MADAMVSKRTEEQVVGALQTASRRVLVPLEVGFWTLLCLAMAATSAYAAWVYPEDRFILGAATLIILIAPVLLVISYYARANRAVQAQDWYTWLLVVAFLLAGLINANWALDGEASAWIPAGASVVLSLVVLFVRFTKKASWTHDAGPVPTVFFRGAIAKDKKTNMVRMWMFTVPLFVLGISLGILRGWDSWAVVPTFLGGFSTLFVPIWAYFGVPPAFLDKSPAELKGRAIPGERFVGAALGTSFPMRPGIRMEDVDNSIFVTTHRLMVVTIPGLRMGPRVQDTSQFYKSSAYHFLKEKGDALLHMEPQKVVEAHDYTFAVPYDQIKSLHLTAGLGLKLAGVNVVTVETEDGTYRLLVHYPDEFEKLRGLLTEAAPGKVR